jgi:acetaldehyde dehydrogenase/alcohol dehydrogenase
MQAVKMIFKYLPRAYHGGVSDPVAREKVHNAATIAGMAFANAFLGICHSMAHKLGGTFHVPHGLANAALITHVIRYNATDAPYRQATFSQYTSPDSLTRYAELADSLGLGGETREQKVIKLIEAVEDLKAQLDVPPTIKEIVGAEKEDLYMGSTLEMAYQAFDDQCTGANPR